MHTPASVLITGATGGFGQAFAQRFAALGSRLILHGRDAQKLTALVREFPGAQTVCCDMADTKAIARIFWSA